MRCIAINIDKINFTLSFQTTNTGTELQQSEQQQQQYNLADEAGLDQVQRQIRRLLVLPSTQGPSSLAVSSDAGPGRGRRRRGRRRGRKRGRRRRRRRRRGRGGRDDELEEAAASPKVDFSEHGQSKFIDDKLNGLQDGFYVESGATDGETGSNSMFFELQRNWNGLLVEPNPKYFTALRDKKRRAYALNACLSPTGDTTTVRYITTNMHCIPHAFFM